MELRSRDAHKQRLRNQTQFFQRNVIDIISHCWCRALRYNEIKKFSVHIFIHCLIPFVLTCTDKAKKRNETISNRIHLQSGYVNLSAAMKIARL